MRFIRSRYQSALEVLQSYPYPAPFHIYLKSYYRKNKKMGSGDRKAISSICYNYWRLGRMADSCNLEFKLAIAASLLPEFDEKNWSELDLIPNLDPGYFSLSVRDKLNLLSDVGYIEQAESYYDSRFLGNAFLNLNVPAVFEFRPKVWIHAKAEQDQPENATASKELEHAFWLEEATDVANEFQVQDFAAQYLCSQIKINDGSKIWDCCAGSGGKTLNLSARFNARWFLSDVRSSIIENAQRRLSDLSAHYAVINLENELKTLRFGAKNLSLEYFDAIIADIPCSGSGTWFRTPEHFSLFDYDKLLDYQKRQLNIVQNVIPYLKSGGILYYLTCSVFGAENEEVLSRLDTADLQVESTINFNGLDSGSDSMFMAILRKS